MWEPKKSDWQLYKIPPPPLWLMWVIIIAFIVIAVVQLPAHGAQRNDLPGGYAGRPPTNQKWPGKCWCQYHGPRGGCMQWHCPGKR